MTLGPIYEYIVPVVAPIEPSGRHLTASRGSALSRKH
jgi:hypothetical protein